MTGILRAAGWWFADYVYAAVWQVRSFWSRTNPESFASGSGSAIVVLPGVYETWKFLQPLVEELHARGHPVHVLEEWGRNSAPVPEMAERVAGYLRARGLDDVILVAHSKGGLAGKLVMVGPEGHRVRRMFAIATPFGGSRYARLMPGRTLRAFRPRDASILELARHGDVNARIVSLYARFDPHIPEGSELAGARNVKIDTGGHFRILAHPRVIAEISAQAD
ncbi:MAG: esterase/lipase family protein [Actinomycetota bacterium]